MFRISPMIETPPSIHQIRMLQTIIGVCSAALLSALVAMGGL
ncbi:hypothetical protein GGQ73_000601 [Rhizobium skierniewicense]|uniref:Uncharacterized protein n=1 Tax=Rhizobium skierniewicense TaxID=984260 RepID=A0A7W6G1M1_9HYPH|nr:hypothetical protein [Rhizobium skierniewicense]MBB3944676.1 hypothetical protein [Rhizobium skierniewicense]